MGVDQPRHHDAAGGIQIIGRRGQRVSIGPGAHARDPPIANGEHSGSMDLEGRVDRHDDAVVDHQVNAIHQLFSDLPVRSPPMRHPAFAAGSLRIFVLPRDPDPSSSSRLDRTPAD